MKDVHTRHCCYQHGCKYGDKDCTVLVHGLKAQEGPCEYCEYPLISEVYVVIENYGYGDREISSIHTSLFLARKTAAACAFGFEKEEWNDAGFPYWRSGSSGIYVEKWEVND